MVFLHITEQSSFMQYHYRLIVFPKGQEEPILSLNLESNPMAGTSCLGAHIGDGHENLGFAEVSMSEADFRTWAVDHAKKYLSIGGSPPKPSMRIEIVETEPPSAHRRERDHVASDSRRTSKVLRWIAVLPAAVVAYVLARFLIIALNRLMIIWYAGVPPDSFLLRLYVTGMGEVVGGAVLVAVGAYVAPQFKVKVAVVLAALVLLTAGFLLFPAVWLKDYWTRFAIICMAVGSGSTAYGIYSGEVVELGNETSAFFSKK
jgi:hypothetical protein